MRAKKRAQSSSSSPGKAGRKRKAQVSVPRSSSSPPYDLPEATGGGQDTDGDAAPQAPAGYDAPPQALAGVGAPQQALASIDAPPQAPTGLEATPQAPCADSGAPKQVPDANGDASQQDPVDDAGPSQPTRAKGKCKSKGKVKAKGVSAAQRQDNSLSQEQEEDLVEWMRENDAVWRRGHHMYKARKQLWTTKATDLGVSSDHLEGWWKSVKDWFVRLMKRQSGQATKKLTDREKWILDRIAFYTPQLKSNEGENAPMKVIQRQEPQPQPLSPGESDSDSELPPRQPSQATQSPQPGQLSQQLDDLEGMETMAATQGRQESESRYSTKSSRRKRKRTETTEEEWMHELRDSIRANTAMMAQLVQQRPTDFGREPFITYVQDSLRSLPEEKYQLVRGKITAVLHIVTPTATATTDRPSQSQSDPPQAAVQYQPQPPQQQPPSCQAPFMQQPPTPQHAFKQQQAAFVHQPPVQQPAFNQPQAPFMQQQPAQQPAFNQPLASYQQFQQQTASRQSDSSFNLSPSTSTSPPQQTDNSMTYIVMKAIQEDDEEWN